jgi:cytidylate kinase
MLSQQSHTDRELIMPTITISRQLGSAGAEVAARAAELLGYEVVDKQLITEVARRAKVPEEEVEKYDEQEEIGIRAFLESLVTGGTAGGEGAGVTAYPWSLEIPYQMPIVIPRPKDEAEISEEVHFLDQQSCLRFVQATIHQLYQHGNVIIVGRAAMMVLDNLPGELSVRLFASEDFRIERLMREEGRSYRETRDLVRVSDRRRGAYVKRHYHVDWNDPALYHLVINMEKTGVEFAAQTIAHAARQVEKDRAQVASS